MKNILIALTATASLLLASCAGSAGGSTALAGSTKPYTKDTCLVTGNKLGSMGTPVALVHEGQEVRLCCRPCVAKFKANPERYLSKL